MHVDELRMLDDTPVAASMASSWSALVLGVSEKHGSSSMEPAGRPKTHSPSMLSEAPIVMMDT